jgi:aminomuconate-semialdehyde/2-hydroxymuconate-6-semialdehyde dehydrogenase
MDVIKNYIGDALVDAHSGQTLDNVEPATGQVYSTVPDSSATDVAAAVAAAQQAFAEWSSTPAARRAKAMNRIADLIDRDREALARAETIDNGKPLSLARQLDIPRAAVNLRFFAAAATQSASEAHVMEGQALNYTLRNPRGVVGIISPWNLPLYLLTWKIAPALATGNTVVAKPSEVTPMTAFRLSELCLEAGLPAGVLNIVHGTGPSAGAALVEHPEVSTVSFTGGTATGELIARAAAPQFKKVALEMGGKNANIVFADADLDEALPTSVQAAFANQGQICLCGSRLFVDRAIYNDFLPQFVEQAKALVVGDPLEDATQQGALVSRAQLEKVSRYVDLARQDGGTVHCGGASPDEINDRCRQGFFFKPTVISNLDVQCRVNQEEIFGPVVTITPFDSEDQVVDYANATRYGLAGSVWTTNLKRAHRVAARIQSGTIWVNCWMIRDLRVPFGGTKSSGVGREGGQEAMRFFTEPKNVCVKVS